MSTLTSVVTVVTLPFIVTFNCIYFLASNILLQPLGYLSSICIYTPLIKIPFILPARYFLELDKNDQVHLIPSLTRVKHRASVFVRALSVAYSVVFGNRGMNQDQIERLIAQLTLFFTTTFHFIMTAIYIGLLAGVILGTVFSFISWFFTLSAETEANITIGLQNKVNQVTRFVPSKSTFSRLKFRLWSGRSKNAAVPPLDNSGFVSPSSGFNAPDLYPKVKSEGPFYQPYSARFDDYDDYDEQQAYLSQEFQNKGAASGPFIKQEVKPINEMESIIEEESNGSDGTEIIDYQSDANASEADTVESSEDVGVYPTPDTDHELHTDRSGLRQRLRQERLHKTATPSDSDDNTSAIPSYSEGKSVGNDNSSDADIEEEASGGESSSAANTTDASEGDTSEDASEAANEEASVTNVTHVSGDDFIKNYQIDEPVIDSLNESES
ncbi:hypothetical protein CANMA_003023 [Candida margitis]|uniref:uncharacterized protein n=1 Tax=Candida margitis TaxID=1775924 RepID=UPI002226D511|nr:uncharacterized protein CANMA_003023 [Candida margitis]KAI5967477.1 hypothetical protein CANMA_003023 [Candida margitis]